MAEGSQVIILDHPYLKAVSPLTDEELAVLRDSAIDTLIMAPQIPDHMRDQEFQEVANMARATLELVAARKRIKELEDHILETTVTEEIIK